MEYVKSLIWPAAKPDGHKRVNLNDAGAVKRQLDTSATELITHRGYREDMTLSNIKIFLGALACGVALLAQFYPQKFPDNRNLLIVCIAVYVVLHIFLQLLLVLWEKNLILVTKAKEDSFTQTGLAVSSKMPRCSDIYTLRVESSDKRHVMAKKPVEFSASVTKWFTTEGVFVESVFLKEVERLLKSYEAQDVKKAR